MEVKKTITINIEKKGKNIICFDLPTLTMVMGSTSVSGNFQYYGVKKEKNKYVVSIDKVKERISEIQRRINRDIRKVDLMKQIIQK